VFWISHQTGPTTNCSKGEVATRSEYVELGSKKTMRTTGQMTKKTSIRERYQWNRKQARDQKKQETEDQQTMIAATLPFGRQVVFLSTSQLQIGWLRKGGGGGRRKYEGSEKDNPRCRNKQTL
jgi:hypothetical protein